MHDRKHMKLYVVVVTMFSGHDRPLEGLFTALERPLQAPLKTSARSSKCLLRFFKRLLKTFRVCTHSLSLCSVFKPFKGLPKAILKGFIVLALVFYGDLAKTFQRPLQAPLKTFARSSKGVLKVL